MELDTYVAGSKTVLVISARSQLALTFLLQLVTKYFCRLLVRASQASVTEVVVMASSYGKQNSVYFSELKGNR